MALAMSPKSCSKHHRTCRRQALREAFYGRSSFRRSSSGSLAKFPAIRRASSLVSSLVSRALVRHAFSLPNSTHVAEKAESSSIILHLGFSPIISVARRTADLRRLAQVAIGTTCSQISSIIYILVLHSIYGL